MREKFEIRFLKDATEFINDLDEKTRTKIISNLDKARIANDRVLFKKLKGEVWEFRTFYNKAYYRLFAFWDKSNRTESLVISTHGIVKKSGKVPQNEIGKAERLRKGYLQNK